MFYRKLNFIPLVVLLIIFQSLCQAESYKCVLNGKTIYQDHPCTEEGASSLPIDISPDITPEQQREAQIKWRAKLKQLRLQREQARRRSAEFQEYMDRQRLIRAQEDQARALEEAARNPPVVIIDRY